MDSLSQRYLFATKSFQLLDNKVTIKEKSMFEETEWEARYEDLGLDTVKIKNREGISNFVLFGGLLGFSIFITFKAFTDGKTDFKLALIFFFSCFVWGWIIMWSIQKYITAHYILTGGDKSLEFFTDSPNNKQVLTFIDKIREKTKSKMKTEYTIFDQDLTFEDQLNNLKYLKAKSIISNVEFETIKEDLRRQHLIK
jgi:hypothetical protein